VLVLQRRVRRPVAELSVRRGAAALALLYALAPLGAFAATASPVPLSQLHLPTTEQHSEFIVAVNAKGLVTKVTPLVHAKDPSFDKLSYSNAPLVTIRHPDGTAVPGTYTLIYDYDPKTYGVKRTVELRQAGGVDPNATAILTLSARHNNTVLDRAAAHESPLPDFQTITGHK
jgi:hypothetical protein